MASLKLLVTGFNAFNQLTLHNPSTTPSRDNDIRSFTTLIDHRADIKVLFAGWSSTVFLLDNTDLYVAGHSELSSHANGSSTVLITSNGFVPSSITTVFGDHNGPVGLLTSADELYLFETSNSGKKTVGRYSNPNGNAVPAVTHLAITHTGRTSVVLRPELERYSIQISEFPSFSEFLTWYVDANGKSSECRRHDICTDGDVEDLQAGATCFILLTTGGEIFTWGDSRHPECLARSPTTCGAAKHDPSECSLCEPAERPSRISALRGMSISKIDAGSWVFGALHEDVVYVWGSGKPGGQGFLGDNIIGNDEVTLVNVNGFESLKDFSVGDDHVAVLTETGEVWVLGENVHGQLGLGPQRKDGAREWTMVGGIEGNARSVKCGGLSTFVTVETPCPVNSRPPRGELPEGHMTEA